MKLKQIVKDIPHAIVKGSKELEITGISSNSKLITPGNLFVARRGKKEDGSRYIPEACASGALAVLSDMYDPSLKQVTQIVVKDVVDAESKAASAFYGHPSQELFMVGITGTSGKTTTSYAAKHILDSFQRDAGMIGTIEYVSGKNRYSATRTTPDVSLNHKLLREMVAAGSKSCVMEVTSHALDQGRVREIEFDAAIFTNLTPEHLDYHLTMEEYGKAKAKLFSGLKALPGSKKSKNKVAIINSDDPWSALMISSCPAQIITYGIDKEADVRAFNIRFSSKGCDFDVRYKGMQAACSWQLVGRYNVYNALAAISLALSMGYPLENVCDHLKSFIAAPGRLEKVDNVLGLTVFVDYAHKPDALDNVLRTLRELAQGRIITVFGCGGDRDREKRPVMAKISEELSDVTIVTSDNPRSEDPEAIIKEILNGFKKPHEHPVKIDRQEAISHAIDIARPNDIVLIAGKGHEAMQIFANRIIDFDDRKVAKMACEKRASVK